MKPPAFQFYARDWLSSTLGMPWDVAGLYIHLLAWSWDNGPLPDDAKWRQRVIGQAHAKLWGTVRSRWVKTPTGWINPRLEQQRELQASFRKRAQKGANARWQASPKHMQKRWPASASASASSDLNKPAASRPVPFRVYAAIAASVLKQTADLDLEPSAIAEEFKRACAKQELKYDATIVQKAMDAAQTARTKRRA
jgi:uncharacterized protein YdaU (DUF1376 family)